ncbi:hypothetical protein L226DRAFT_567324 [Lentinus tigrinus ALCF2SS1-7]|uniref:Zn(2)-C6 fungal-type domain-containing protein n=1 Tax=Lentinus tigrinus ALCF2SS1-6 TaxID=1328759 RepID=A0A5C2SQP3_9APHY|nr:hypothetical protein L227DRAFT_606949 [Lentinus tigrinus ALCF2SS1-6]RPD79152.1 hypothetical protein L226DRAFT_567324 [Lentinus tigrinus ALCF2SS1-7]
MSTASSSRPLSRGAACLPCRKLKAKCDGNKPACGRCIANNRPDDCEYATGAEVTRSRLLEENIALLEARIKELENPGETAPSVQLHDPRRQASTSAAGPSRLLMPAMAGPSGIPLYPASMGPPVGETHRPPRIQRWFTRLRNVAHTAHVPEPTPQEVQMLIQIFMANASQLGFFLNPTRFRRGGAPHQENDALMNAVYLWGSKLSNSTGLRARESYFANRATQAASSATMMAQATAVLHMIQAEVLLANYFFTTGRLLEGRYHTLAAVALVTGSRYHLIDVGTMGGDPIGAGERIQAFWTVMAQDKMWAAAMNTPSVCQSGRTNIQITTPWPLATGAYEQGMVVPHSGNYSVEDFLRGAVDDSNEDFSPLAIRVKSCGLHDRAIYIAQQYRVDMPNRNEFLARFGALDTLIERYHRQLAGIRNRSPEDMREVLVARTITCTAAIQLHSTFSSHQPMSWQKTVCVAVAAGRALDVVNVSQGLHLDPILAVLWSTICKVLVGELRRVLQSATPVRQEEVANITSSLDKITATMTTLSANSPLMGQHLAEIQQARAMLA